MGRPARLLGMPCELSTVARCVAQAAQTVWLSRRGGILKTAARPKPGRGFESHPRRSILLLRSEAATAAASPFSRPATWLLLLPEQPHLERLQRRALVNAS